MLEVEDVRQKESKGLNKRVYFKETFKFLPLDQLRKLAQLQRQTNKYQNQRNINNFS